MFVFTVAEIDKHGNELIVAAFIDEDRAQLDAAKRQAAEILVRSKRTDAEQVYSYDVYELYIQ